MKNGLKLFFNVVMRIFAAFTASALGVIGAGAIANVGTLKACTVAGLTAIATVVEKLARGFMDDGKLTMDEINSAFAAIDTQAKTEADLQVEARQTNTAVIINPDGTKTLSSQGAPAVAAAPVVDSTPEAPVDSTPAAPAVTDPNYN